MPYIKKVLLTYRLWVVVTLLFCCASAQAQDTISYWVVTKAGLNLRSSASSKGEKLLTIPDGAEVQLIENSGTSEKIGKITGQWLKVRWQNHTGYAFSGFLSAGKPIALDTNRPLHDQLAKICFGSAEKPPEDCAGVCGNSYFILDANHNYSRAREDGPPGCQGLLWTDMGKWSVRDDAIILEFSETKDCYTSCEEYCSARVEEEQPFDCKKYCPVKGKIPNACPAKMTRIQYQEKFSKKYEIVLNRNKKGEFVVEKGAPGWKVGTNFGLPYLPK